jgi:phosphoketolase
MNKFTREGKENARVDLFFASLIDRFHTAMFEVDHDDPKTPKADVFALFNRAWVKFAEEHNKKVKKVGADPNAFYDYAIKQD